MNNWVSYVGLSADHRFIGYKILVIENGRKRWSSYISTWEEASELAASEAARIGLHGLYRGIPQN